MLYNYHVVIFVKKKNSKGPKLNVRNTNNDGIASAKEFRTWKFPHGHSHQMRRLILSPIIILEV